MPAPPASHRFVIVAVAMVVGVFVRVVVFVAVAAAVTVVVAMRLSLARHLDGRERQQLPGAPAQASDDAVNDVARRPDIDHDIGAVLDEFAKSVAAGDLEAAIGRRDGFADQIIDILIAVAGTHLGTRNWFPGPLLSHKSHDGMSVHTLVPSSRSYDNRIWLGAGEGPIMPVRGPFVNDRAAGRAYRCNLQQSQ
jgi:hypothetical protein